MKAFIARHSVATYFVLTFGISWGGVLLAIRGDAVSGVNAENNPRFPLVVVAMLAGPSLTSVFLTWLTDGTQGLRELQSRLLAWCVAARWYAVALLTAPLLAMTAALTLSRFSAEFLPAVTVADDKSMLVLFGIVIGLMAGLFEELGWTGFAIPRLRRRHGILATGLIVGALWSAWHVPAAAWGMGARAGTVPVPLFLLVDGVAGLPVFRVLMVWVYDRTGSLLLGILMHVSLTAGLLILTPPTTGAALLTFSLTFAAFAWMLLAVIHYATTGMTGAARSRLLLASERRRS